MSWKHIAMAGTFLVAAACAPDDGADTAPDAAGADTAALGNEAADGASRVTARAELRDSSGNAVGQVVLEQQDNGVQVTLNVEGLAPGEHGVHFHSVGQCDAAGESPFESADGHFNPDSTQHGLENPQGPHAGDLPNMEVGDDGTGTLSETTDRLTLTEGPNALLDGDGAAFIVHAGPDDMVSDPSGNSGDRVACGVIERS